MSLSSDDEHAREDFFQACVSFIRDVECLAESPEVASKMQGNYNVAHEFWCLIPRTDYFLRAPVKLLSDEQRSAVESLLFAISKVPPEARKWTTVSQESVENLRHSSWESTRKQAKQVCDLLRPVTALMVKHFSS